MSILEKVIIEEGENDCGKKNERFRKRKRGIRKGRKQPKKRGTSNQEKDKSVLGKVIRKKRTRLEKWRKNSEKGESNRKRENKQSGER